MTEAKVKKPNPYAKPKAENPNFVYKHFPKEQIHKVGDWETTKTDHAVERADQRSGGDLPGGHHDFMHKVVKHVSNVKNPRNGEFYYHSKKHDQGAFLYVHHNPKQIRVKTILPKGKSHMTQAGDKMFMVEGSSLENCVLLNDDDFDLAFEQFVMENYD